MPASCNAVWERRRRRWSLLSLPGLRRTPGSNIAAFVRSPGSQSFDRATLIAPPLPPTPPVQSGLPCPTKTPLFLPPGPPPRAELSESRNAEPARSPSELGATQITELPSKTQDFDCPIRAGKHGTSRCAWRPTREGGYGFANLSRMREHVSGHGLRCSDCTRIFGPARVFKEHRKHKNLTGVCLDFNALRKTSPNPIALPVAAIEAFLELPSQLTGNVSDYEAWIEGYKFLNPNWAAEGPLPSPFYTKNKAQEAALSATTSTEAQPRAAPTLSLVGATSNAPQHRALSAVSLLTPASNVGQADALSAVSSVVGISPLLQPTVASNAPRNSTVSSVSPLPVTSSPPQIVASSSLDVPLDGQSHMHYVNQISDSMPSLSGSVNAQLDLDIELFGSDDRQSLPSWQTWSEPNAWDNMICEDQTVPSRGVYASGTFEAGPLQISPVELEAPRYGAMLAPSTMTASAIDAWRLNSRSPSQRGLSLDTRGIEPSIPTSSGGSGGSSRQDNPWSSSRISPLTNSSKVTTPSSACSLQKRRFAAKRMENRMEDYRSEIRGLRADIQRSQNENRDLQQKHDEEIQSLRTMLAEENQSLRKTHEMEKQNLLEKYDQAEQAKQNAWSLLSEIQDRFDSFDYYDEEAMECKQRLHIMDRLMNKLRELLQQRHRNNDTMMTFEETNGPAMDIEIPPLTDLLKSSDDD